jgi:DNA polymerase-3 subunit gamma/tau
MSYLVLARKYRPQSFDAVVEQNHVTQTLINAISTGRVSHAILFTGPRGTGKTTVARILAKAMTCSAGPTPEPCNECRSCREITSGKAVDVFEIDGASNNSVDQVRELRDNVAYMPAHSAYKIYIIDEVHMLSTPAFNALLKTLEEPPAHVIFIFATTEPHKIPATILSRCQRHDFRRISMAAMTDHLLAICAREKFDISRDSLTQIAREAGGSIRDALSLLDQVTACSEGTVEDTQVLDLLGIIDPKMIFDLTQALLQADAQRVLAVLDVVHQRGHDMKRLHADLVQYFRHLVVIKTCQRPEPLVDLPTHDIQQMRELVETAPAAHLNQLFDLLFQEEPAVKLSAQPKIALEMACLKLLQAEPVLAIESLIEKLDSLRRHIAASPPDTARRAADPSSSPAGGADCGPDQSTANGPATLVPTDAPSAAEPVSPAALKKAWQEVRAAIASDHPALAAHLRKSRPIRMEGNRLEVDVTDNGFNLAMIQKAKNLAILGKACQQVFGRPIEIVLKAAVGAFKGPDHSKKPKNQLRNEALSHPLVADAVKIFDGEVLGVTITKEDKP